MLGSIVKKRIVTIELSFMKFDEVDDDMQELHMMIMVMPMVLMMIMHIEVVTDDDTTKLRNI